LPTEFFVTSFLSRKVSRHLIPNFLKFGVARLEMSTIFGLIAGIHAFPHSVSGKECFVANRNQLFVAV
jgi:hypothetical protein